MRFRFVCIVATVATMSCDSSLSRGPVSDVAIGTLTPLPASSASWAGLKAPATIHVATDGSVYIADNGDSKIRVYDPFGKFLREFGGFGGGPGEFGIIRDIVVSKKVVNVFDATGTRFLRLGTDGTYETAITISGMGDETVAALGGERIIMASSARWSLPTSSAQDAWPLARVLNADGSIAFDVGNRTPISNPFAAHIKNFVLPAGTADGRFVWLAFLNSPDIVLYSVQDGVTRRIERTLPFRWKSIPDDFTPSATPPEPGKPFNPPFDAISYDIATDTAGRAFVLTALQSSREAGGQPAKMGIDVLAADDTVARRFEVEGYFTHLGVSPDGGIIYLLDSSSGRVRSFAHE